MKAKLYFAFAGTGGTAQEMKSFLDNTSFPFEQDVVQIYFNGCHDSQIGGKSFGLGYIAPNLDTVAEKIKSCFNSSGALSLEKLKQIFGDSIIIEPQEKMKETIEAESICMSGFSRGAVTSFAVARHLDDLNIPMYIFAQEPVPGEDKYSAAINHSTLQKNQDLRGCQNIKKAEVIIGAYQKNLNGLHNKYLRQMAPFFPESCQASIYVAPKSSHTESNAPIHDQFIQFLIKNQFKKTSALSYTRLNQKFHFIPKIIQQKHHHSVIGRTKTLPLYKNLLYQQQHALTSIEKDMPIKTAQALISLYTTADYECLKTLQETIEKDKTPKGIATREFMVELENILQYALKKDEMQNPIIKNFKLEIYSMLAGLNFENPSEIQKQYFKKYCLDNLDKIKPLIGFLRHQELSQLFTLFLNENMIFHTDLTQYIDESETFLTPSSKVKSPEEASISLQEASSSAQAAEILYHMSKNSRNSAYSKLPIEIIHNVSDFTEIARFLPAKDIKKLMLRCPEEIQFKNIDEFINCMKKMFYPEQKKVIFEANLVAIAPLIKNFSSINELLNMLTEPQKSMLLPLIAFDKLKLNSSQEIINLVTKLDHHDILAISSKLSYLIQYSQLDTKEKNDFIQYINYRCAMSLNSQMSIKLNPLFALKTSEIIAQNALSIEETRPALPRLSS
jgi:hypothetical protein